MARYAVALSYASEQRGYVEAVAHCLADRYGEMRILYDGFHRAELSNPELGIALPAQYLQSSVVVVFCSHDYRAKNWTNLEWREILLKRIRRGQSSAVLPVQLDDLPIGELPGLTIYDGGIDGRAIPPSTLSDIIASRVDSRQHARRVLYFMAVVAAMALGVMAGSGHAYFWNPDTQVGNEFRVLMSWNAGACVACACFFFIVLFVDKARSKNRGFDTQVQYGVLVPLAVAFCIWAADYGWTVYFVEKPAPWRGFSATCNYTQTLLFLYSGMIMLHRTERLHQLVPLRLREHGRSSKGLVAKEGIVGVLIATLIVTVCAWYLFSDTPSIQDLASSPGSEPVTDSENGTAQRTAEGFWLAATAFAGLSALALGLTKALNRRKWDLYTMAPSGVLTAMAFLQVYYILNPSRTNANALLVAYSLKLGLLFSLVVVAVTTVEMYREHPDARSERT